ncbi:MAG: hypothetical protein KF901_30970 [Myxococcales bacterium]|nr:hypothetical protein [Myxococcales bacterium]
MTDAPTDDDPTASPPARAAPRGRDVTPRSERRLANMRGLHASVTRRLAARLALALLFFGALTVGARASAQGDFVFGGGRLPEPPAGYAEREEGSVRWTYPESARASLDRLRETLAREWPRLAADLGQEVDDTLVVRLARNPDEMRALAPRGAPPPPYAAGVAYPHLGVILLTLTAPETWTPPELEEVFTHELSHVALRRAVTPDDETHRALPRWFVEGVAIHHADERSLARFQALWNAHLQETLVPLDELDARFPERVHEVSVAYAQAADVVSFLRREDPDGTRFRKLIRRLRAGDAFDDALLDAYALTPTQLEREWQAALADRMGTLPMVLGGTTFWVLAAGLLVWAWRKRKGQARRRLATMAAEEKAHDDAVDRMTAAIDARLAAAAADANRGEDATSPRGRSEVDDDEAVRLLVSGDPPQGRERGVPTVEHDGREHTLH